MGGGETQVWKREHLRRHPRQVLLAPVQLGCVSVLPSECDRSYQHVIVFSYLAAFILRENPVLLHFLPQVLRLGWISLEAAGDS